MNAYAEWKGRRFLLTGENSLSACSRVAASVTKSYGPMGVQAYVSARTLSHRGLLIDLIEALDRSDAHKSHFESRC